MYYNRFLRTSSSSWDAGSTGCVVDSAIEGAGGKSAIPRWVCVGWLLATPTKTFPSQRRPNSWGRTISFLGVLTFQWRAPQSLALIALVTWTAQRRHGDRQGGSPPWLEAKRRHGRRTDLVVLPAVHSGEAAGERVAFVFSEEGVVLQASATCFDVDECLRKAHPGSVAAPGVCAEVRCPVSGWPRLGRACWALTDSRLQFG